MQRWLIILVVALMTACSLSCSASEEVPQRLVAHAALPTRMFEGWWHDAAFAVWDDACTAAREAGDTPESLGWKKTSVTRHGSGGTVEKMTGRFRCPDGSLYEVTILFDADRP